MVIIHVDSQRATAAGDTARGISHRQVRCCLDSAGRSQAHRPPQPALAQRPLSARPRRSLCVRSPVPRAHPVPWRWQGLRVCFLTTWKAGTHVGRV